MSDPSLSQDRAPDPTADHDLEARDLDQTGDASTALYLADEPTGLSLWEGDEGGLEVPQRRALVVLLKQRFISAQTHRREWDALVANPRPIRARLNDLFLDLHLDTEREVAFKRQAFPEGGGRYPTLLYDAPWTREETILLVYLRARLRTEQAAGAERVFVDKQDMVDYVAQFRPSHATDEAGDAKRAAKAVETLFKAGLLNGRSTGDRFELSTAIEVILPLPRLQELLTWLREQNAHATDETTPPDLADHGATDPDSPDQQPDVDTAATPDVPTES